MIRADHPCSPKSGHLHTPLLCRNNRIDACVVSTTPNGGVPSIPDALNSASGRAVGTMAGGGWAEGSTGGEECRRGLKMRTTMRPKMIKSRRKMHWRRPVFFWYLRNEGGVTLALLVERYWTTGVHKRRSTCAEGGHWPWATEEKPPRSDTP